VRITSKSTIENVIAAVGEALGKAGIDAVLVGGACATVYSGGIYTSDDLDLVPRSDPSQRELDAALARIGFTRQDAQYFHDESEIFVEFQRGPVSIGRDAAIKPVPLKLGRTALPALSATDSCRDRLAAFYHWNDRQALEVAVAIAVNNRVDQSKIRAWSAGEGASAKFDEFKRDLARARKRTPRGGASMTPKRRTARSGRQRPGRRPRTAS
jgi:hypothetical protein